MKDGSESSGVCSRGAGCGVQGVGCGVQGVQQACDPSTQKIETGGLLRAQSQHGLQSNSVLNRKGRMEEVE